MKEVLILSGNVFNAPERKISSYYSAPSGFKPGEVLAAIRRFEQAFDNVRIKYDEVA